MLFIVIWLLQLCPMHVWISCIRSVARANLPERNHDRREQSCLRLPLLCTMYATNSVMYLVDPVICQGRCSQAQTDKDGFAVMLSIVVQFDYSPVGCKFDYTGTYLHVDGL